MKQIIKLLAIVGSVFCCNLLYAQENTKELILSELHRLQEFYTKNKGLKFDIKYSYANENTPTVHLDSIAGHIELAKNNYRLTLDKVETIKNDKYTIHLFSEDSIMYIAGNRGSSNISNPAVLFDSSILKSNAEFTLITQGEIRVITIAYPIGQPCRTLTLNIDAQSGLLRSTSAIIKTTYMVDPGEIFNSTNIPGYDEYAVVETHYSNYNKSEIKDTELSERNFFIKTGKEFTTTEKYKGYKIFIGTPNL